MSIPGAKNVGRNVGRKVGRPKVGATPVNVRFPPNELAALDEWVKAEPDKPTRAEAVRRIVRKSF